MTDCWDKKETEPIGIIEKWSGSLRNTPDSRLSRNANALVQTHLTTVHRTDTCLLGSQKAGIWLHTYTPITKRQHLQRKCQLSLYNIYDEWIHPLASHMGAECFFRIQWSASYIGTHTSPTHQCDYLSSQPYYWYQHC